MADTPKDAGRDRNRVYGRTHTAEELADFRPLRLGGLRVLIALIVFNVFGMLKIYGMLRSPGGNYIEASITGFMFGVAMLIPLAFGLTGFQNPIGWLREYWRRNVRGYAVAYWLDDQGMLVGNMGRRLPLTDQSKSERSPTIYLPLGGWLHRPRFGDRINDLHNHDVRVRWPWFESTPDRVWVIDGEGARVKLWMHDALAVWNPSLTQAGFAWQTICSKMHRDLKYRERDLQTAYIRLLEVYDRIVATKRFIKSTQAQAIADDLRRRLHDELPYDHPRRAEFAKRPTAKAAPAATNT